MDASPGARIVEKVFLSTFVVSFYFYVAILNTLFR